jgi:hypothetical protein
MFDTIDIMAIVIMLVLFFSIFLWFGAFLVIVIRGTPPVISWFIGFLYFAILLFIAAGLPGPFQFIGISGVTTTIGMIAMDNFLDSKGVY